MKLGTSHRGPHVFLTLCLAACLLVFSASDAHAYLDPGSTGLLFQIFSVIAAAVVGYFLAFRRMVSGMFGRLLGRKGKKPSDER
jgi:hypothetical protein